MRTKLLIFVSLLSAASLRAQQLTIGSPPPPPVSSITANTTGASGTGTECYWLVARYPIGNILSGSSCVSGVGFAQGGSVNVNWATVPGATGYDVLRTAGPSFPGSGACTNCLLSSNSKSGSVNDTGASLGSYSLTSGVSPASATIYINNRDFSAPQIVFPSYLLNVQGLQFPDGTKQTTAGSGGVPCVGCTDNTIPISVGGTLQNSNLSQDALTGELLPEKSIGALFAIVPPNAGSPNFDLSLCNICSLTLGADSTATATNFVDPKWFTFIVVTNNHALTWPANFVGFPSIVAGAGSLTIWQHAYSDGTNVNADGPAFSSASPSESTFTEKPAPSSPVAGVLKFYADSTSLTLMAKDQNGVRSGMVDTHTSAAHHFITTIDPTAAPGSKILDAQPASTDLSDVALLVFNNAANTAAAGMTLDMHAATGATAFRVPVIAGATAGADGVIDYDSTAKSTKIRTNGADSIAAAFASAPAGGNCLQSSGTTGLITEAAAACGSASVSAGNGITVLGSTVNFNPMDSGQMWFRDDFFPNAVSPGLGTAIGQLAWRTTAIASGGAGNISNTGGTFPHLGIFVLKSDGTATHGLSLSAATSASGKLMGDMKTNTNWDSFWIFQFTQTTAESIYFGFTADNTTITPTDAIGMRFDTALADTSITFFTTAASTTTTSTTNSIAADTSFHCARIRSTVSGTIKFSIGSTCTTLGTETSISTNVPTAALQPSWSIVQTTTAAAPGVNIDFWAYQQTGLSR